MYKLGLKLWSTNTDFYYEEAKRLYSMGVFDYIELYVVPDTLNSLEKWKKFSPLAISGDIPLLRRGGAKRRGGCLPLNSAEDENIPLLWRGAEGGVVSKRNTQNYHNLPYNPNLKEHARELRKAGNLSEVLLWSELKNKKFKGLDFDRQKIIGDYIVDFYCPNTNTVIEIDGCSHDNKQEYDAKRDEFLEKSGLIVIHVLDRDVRNNLDGVIEYLFNHPAFGTPPREGNGAEIIGEQGKPNSPPLEEYPSGGGGFFKIPFIIHCPHFAHGFNLAKAEKKASNFEIYKEVKEFADELNAKYIIFHGGIDGNIEETANQLAGFDEPRALIENKPFVALPNRMGGEFCRGFSPDEIKKVIDMAKCGFCLDFGHAICAANSQNKEIYSYCEGFLQFNPNMFHLTDNEDITSPYDSHPHLKTGQLDLNKIKQILPDNAIITLETVKNSKENLDDFIGDVECMRN